MGNIDKNLIDELVEIIYQRIEEKFNKQINSANIEHIAEGVVRESALDSMGNIVNSPLDENGKLTTYANVELPFITLVNISNKTGEPLSDGDKVKIFYNNSDIGTAYIGVKF